MKAIIAVNNLGFIGLKNKLPWKCSEDLEHFKEKVVAGANCLVGYRTYKDLPQKVKNRLILIVPEEIPVWVPTDFIENVDWCIGGKKTYEKYCHLFTELHISHIDNNTIGDTTFPDLSNLSPICKIYNYYFNENL